MAIPLTFGVELEFALACVLNPNDPNPYPSETRKVHFHPTGHRNDNHLENKDTTTTHIRIATDIGTTLLQAGFPVDIENLYTPSTMNWGVMKDDSIEYPLDSKYEYFQMEVVSPAYYFSRQSLRAVENVCRLLTSKYCVSLDESTGLHVHVGNGGDGFTFDTVRNLVALLWAFEPQILTLHSPERLENALYCRPLRKHSTWAHTFRNVHGRNAWPMDGVTHFLGATDIEELVEEAGPGSNFRFSAYNFTNLVPIPEKHRALGVPEIKKTIEFRQHEGTLDPDRVSNWIQTVVGLVSYVQDATPACLAEILGVPRHEIWEKLEDGEDWKREQEMGPILAEGSFTVIDLLKHMRLWGPALFYENRWYKHEKEVDMSDD